MKNTTFRKKALLSSIAMLLVALVALGSATFAWFASNPNANASGLSLKTTASTGLVIRTESDDVWSHAAKFYNAQQVTTFNLTPASQNQEDGNANKFYTIDAADAKESDYDTAKTVTAASVATCSNKKFTTGDVFAEKVYFRLSDGSSAADAQGKKVYLTAVTITPNESAAAQTKPMTNAIRVAIADANNNILGTYSLTDATANGVLVPDTDNKPTKVDTFDLATAATGLNVECYSTNLTTSETLGSNYVTVYVYLDGQDTNCFSDNVKAVNAAEMISSVQVDFTLK